MTNGDGQCIGLIFPWHFIEFQEHVHKSCDLPLGCAAMPRDSLFDLRGSIGAYRELSERGRKQRDASSVAELEGSLGETSEEDVLHGHGCGLVLSDDLDQPLVNTQQA